MKNKLLTLVSSISFVGLIAVYNIIPEIIPLHYNYQGEVDNYGSKISLIILAALPFLFILLFDFLKKVDPKKDSYELHEKAYRMTKTSLILFFILLLWVIVLNILYGFRVDISMKVLIGILFIILGNYMMQIRSNYFFGIKNPWTLASETVWKKTHRLGAYLFTLNGIVIFLDILIKNEYLFVVTILSTVFIVNVYSYIIFKKEQK